MTNNNINNNTSGTTSNYNAFPKQFINYINYELSLFEQITHKKFFLNILSNNRFELISVSETEQYEDKNDKYDNNCKPKYQVVYRANNLYEFIKSLFMIREHLIKNFSNGLTKKNQ